MHAVRVTPTAHEPTARSLLSLVYVPEKNYSLMFGGQVDVPQGQGQAQTFQPRDDLYILNLSSHNRWIPQRSSGTLPSARCGHSASVVDGHMIVWGGRGQKQLSDSHVHAMNISQRDWVQLSVDGDVPKPRFQHAAWTVGNALYIFGGHDGRRTCFHDMYKLSLDFSSGHAEWDEIKPLGEIPKLSGAASAVQMGDYLITVGGSNAQDFSSDVFAYSVTANIWQKFQNVGNVPLARAALSAFVARDRVFVFGGSNGQQRFNDLYVVDLDFVSGIATWARYPLTGDMPDGRSLHSAVVDRDGNVFVYGGWNGSSCFGDLYVLTFYPPAPPAPPAAFSMQSLFLQPHLSDCELTCAGARFPVHKAVLYARSRVFQYWMECWDGTHAVEVSDMCPAVLRSLLEYVYTGRVVIPPGRAHDVLLAADKYALDGLRVAAARECVAALSTATVTDAFAIAESLDLAALKSAALLFVSHNLRQVEQHRAAGNSAASSSSSSNAVTAHSTTPTVTMCSARSNPSTPTGTLPMPMDVQSVPSPVTALAPPTSVAATTTVAVVAAAAVSVCDAEMRDDSTCGKRKCREDPSSHSHSGDCGAAASDDDDGDDSAVLSAPAPPTADEQPVAESSDAAAAQPRKRTQIRRSPTTPFQYHVQQVDSQS